MMSRFALAFLALLFGMGWTFPEAFWLSAQDPDPSAPRPLEVPQDNPDETKTDIGKSDNAETEPVPKKADPAQAEPPETEAPAPQKTPEGEKAENADSARSGFERIDAYEKKWNRLNTFLKKLQAELTDAAPNLEERPSAAVDEVTRLMRVLDTRMLKEAEQILERAMTSEDPELRNRLLKRLTEMETITPLSDVTTHAQDLLNALTVDGKIYDTLEAAREAERKLKQKQRENVEEIDKQYLPDLEKLKQQELSEDLLQAEERLEEQNAREMLESAVRLVLPQRRERLHALLEKYPATEAAAEARAILAAIGRRSEAMARRKLREALCVPVIFDQRWRRLKELIREYPRTRAAAEAEQIFFQHAAQVPPLTITNHTGEAVEITVDVPYEAAQAAELSPGDRESFASAFPTMVRVKVADDEWDVYRALPGASYVLSLRHDQTPVLAPAPPEKPMPMPDPPPAPALR